ncbi:MAG TPA: hypothetical protein VN207_09495 [Ktedonobacteraceae bacterium]|nr:hypothetical protein [Ktedonobacteraceae bacterium]
MAVLGQYCSDQEESDFSSQTIDPNNAQCDDNTPITNDENDSDLTFTGACQDMLQDSLPDTSNIKARMKNTNDNSVECYDNSKGNSNTTVSRSEFLRIVKGFCQAFKADLVRDQNPTSDELKQIDDQGQRVSQVLENSNHNLGESDVQDFESSEIAIANSDFETDNGTYAPGACQQGPSSNAQQDAQNFEQYFQSNDYQQNIIGDNSDGTILDSWFTDTVRQAKDTFYDYGGND